MFEQVLLVVTVLLGVSFLRMLRRVDSPGRGYVLVVAAVLCLALAGWVEGSRFLGVAAIGFATLVVVVPWILEHVARFAFGRGRLATAVRVAGLRAMLMPGAGLARQQHILQGLALLERHGVDRALEHFRELADDTEDDGELVLINEQIVSMLFYGQRWAEGIAHYEARFHPQYAAVRPALALGLLRAYGESGKMGHAAGLLRALENGPVGADPRASGVLSQARLTFLAYAGAASPVTSALDEEGRRALGISAASGALFRGIALSRAGEAGRARVEFERVPELADASDDRIVDAASKALADLSGRDEVADAPDEGSELGEELEGYVDNVAERLESYVRSGPRVRRRSSSVASPVLMLMMLAGYLAVLGLDRGGVGLLQLGAFVPALWAEGQWGRVATGLFLHADPIGTIINVYAVWLAAPLLERLYGSVRVFVAAIASGAAGLVAAAAASAPDFQVYAGGNLVAIALVAAALWSLLPVRTPGLGRRTRRAMVIPLTLMALAQLLSMFEALTSFEVSPIGMGVAAGLGIASLGLPTGAGWTARIQRWALIPVLLGLVAGVVSVARHDSSSILSEQRRATEVGDVARVLLPPSFEHTDPSEPSVLEIPVVEGWVDSLALRSGALVEVVGLPVQEVDPALLGHDRDSSDEEPGLLEQHGVLRHRLSASREAELPEQFAEAYVAAGGARENLRSFALRQNGVWVARVVERSLPGGDRIALLASPPEAIEHAPELYASILAQASPRREAPSGR